MTGFVRLAPTYHPCMRCRLRVDRVGGRMLVIPVGIPRKRWKSHQAWHARMKDAAPGRAKPQGGELEHPQAA